MSEPPSSDVSTGGGFLLRLHCAKHVVLCVQSVIVAKHVTVLSCC
jgi:hypothetical protein